MYYQNKIEHLRSLFQDDLLSVTNDVVVTRNNEYPIIDDVIVLLSKDHYTPYIKKRLSTLPSHYDESLQNHAIDHQIQYTFGKEWDEYSSILPEHKREFEQYFDLIKLEELHSKIVCDLGRGNGRWSYFLHPYVKILILIDFSDAIFSARSNLAHAPNALFIMADLQRLPFKEPFTDFLICLGVLHHLPSSCLDGVKTLKKYSNEFLIYLYYALDNQSIHFKILLSIVTSMRNIISKVNIPPLRIVIAKFLTIFFYYPCIALGTILNVFKLGSLVPLYDGYHGKSFRRIEQDAYDRFFTSIEQRVSRKEIESLSETFSKVIISEHQPYWHFLLKK